MSMEQQHNTRSTPIIQQQSQESQNIFPQETHGQEQYQIPQNSFLQPSTQQYIPQGLSQKQHQKTWNYNKERQQKHIPQKHDQGRRQYRVDQQSVQASKQWTSTKQQEDSKFQLSQSAVQSNLQQRISQQRQHYCFSKQHQEKEQQQITSDTLANVK